jgi:copper chaperone NosL
MKHPLQKFYEFLDRPIHGAGRILLALAVIPLLLSFGEPLWRIRLEAPQYPKGLVMDVFAHKLEGGNHGQHIQEINTLNHYIGMHKIDRAELSDLDWIPFALGLLALLGLRCAAIGNVRALVDLAVLTTYVAGFSMVRFVYKLYVFGHNLDPAAPVTVAPFTPAILGHKQIANFTTYSYPQAGTFLVGAFITTVLGVTIWQLMAGRVRAARAER